MFKINKTRSTGVTPKQEPAPTPSAGEAPRQTKAKNSPDISSDEMQAWQGRILAAGSDDATLLQLAYRAPTTDLKLAALQALTQENSFKQAMREFRDKDKRLYRAAKSRWQDAESKRVAISEANALIATARVLLDQEQVPVNRLVDLDRAWAAVNGKFLEAALPVEFATLSTQLSAKVHAHGEQVRSLTIWLNAVDSAMAQLSTILPGIAQGDTPPTEAETLAVSLLGLLDNVPDTNDARCIEQTNVANRLLVLASSVVQRAKFLQSLPASGVVDAAGEKAMIEQWRAFPELSEGDKNQLQSVLAQRFANWRNASADARKSEHEVHRSQERARRAEQDQLHLQTIQRIVETAEAAHAGGRVAELAGLLTAIDQALKRGPANPALAQRIDFLRLEQVRLQDWQRWSGEQGREQLAAAAQELAQLATGKISIKVHSDAINKLRERWKELDKLDGSSNQTVWLAFDGALKTAYAPVAVHLDKLKLARIENLAARDQIIADLIQAGLKFFPVEGEGATPTSIVDPDWRAIAHTLENARIAWQKLGPVEHTVPRSALQGENAIAIRYAAAVHALQAPLNNAYAEARRRREQLITAANDLGGSDASARDVVDKVRKLQTQWQVVAKTLPLPRLDENTLWVAFKTATDAIFTARDAARVANEAELSAGLKAREEIIDRLAAFGSSSSASDIKRALGDADAALRASADVAKPLQAKLDARYRLARDAATNQLGELAKRALQARFDALIAAMALCHEREAAHDSDCSVTAEQTADMEARWNSIANLPDAWKAPLVARFKGMDSSSSGLTSSPLDAASDKTADAALLDALLNLEVTCGIDSPSDFLAARQRLKIHALKNAMEGRQTANAPADIERWLLAAAAHPRPDALSRERLGKIIAAVRRG
ncbi:MAG: DUF349 domain-containing protein [Burkholderiales bacterium]